MNTSSVLNVVSLVSIVALALAWQSQQREIDKLNEKIEVHQAFYEGVVSGFRNTYQPKVATPPHPPAAQASGLVLVVARGKIQVGDSIFTIDKIGSQLPASALTGITSATIQADPADTKPETIRLVELIIGYLSQHGIYTIEFASK